jgi:hypothetical protein
MVQHIQTKIYDSHATNMNPNPKNTQGKPHKSCHKQLAKTQACVLESQIIFDALRSHNLRLYLIENILNYLKLSSH